MPKLMLKLELGSVMKTTPIYYQCDVKATTKPEANKKQARLFIV